MVWKEIGTPCASTPSTSLRIHTFNPTYSQCDSLSLVAKKCSRSIYNQREFIEIQFWQKQEFLP